MSRTLILSLFVIGLLTGCQTKERETVTRKVKVIHPQLISGSSIRTFSGVVQTPQEITPSFRTPGQIKGLYVKEGDYIRQGQKIAILDDNDYQLQAAASKVQYEQAGKELERLEELYKRNSLPGNDYEKARAGVEALGIQLEADINNLSYTILEAPVAGYIQTLHAREGEMVNAGTAIVTLLDAGTVRIEADMPASLLLQKNDFQRYTCTSHLLPGKQFVLKPSGINYKSNSSQLYKAYLIPETTATELTPGMNVEIAVQIDDPAVEKKYTLPVSALFTENNKNYVWVVNLQDNTVRKKEVIAGDIHASGDILILSGINQTDQVVKAGVEALLENEKVHIVSEPSITNVGGLL